MKDTIVQVYLELVTNFPAERDSGGCFKSYQLNGLSLEGVN